MSLSQHSVSKSTVQSNLVIGPTNVGSSFIDMGDDLSQFKLKPCLACRDGLSNNNTALHDTKKCKLWSSLSLKDRESKVWCHKHPFSSGHKTF